MIRALRNTADRGATAIQYGLIAALVAMAAAAALPQLGGKLSSTICSAAAGLGGSGCGSAPASGPSSYTTMSTCQGAGYVWDGSYCDTPTHQARRRQASAP